MQVFLILFSVYFTVFQLLKLFSYIELTLNYIMYDVFCSSIMHVRKLVCGDLFQYHRGNFRRVLSFLLFPP